MKRLFFLLFALLVTLSAMSVPARRKPFVHRQPDGSQLMVTLIGDEYDHYYLTSDGRRLTESTDGWLVPLNLLQPRSPLNLPSFGGVGGWGKKCSPPSEGRGGGSRATELGGYPTLGSPRELVLLVEYPDCRFTYDADTFRRMLTEEGYRDDGATGSALDYFSDQSRGLFTPDIEVVGPIMLPHPRAYYGSPTANMYDGQPWLMLTDAAPQVDAEIDFSSFDNDGDGFVDNVFIFYAGKGQNDGGPLEAVWPHAANIWTYYALDCTLDGVRLGSYACTNEITSADRMTGIGTFCHEYSHILGLPDLYSTVRANDCFSPGAFELMDSGPYNNEGRTPPNMSAYDRALLRWCNPELLSAPETVVLRPDGTARTILTVKDEEYYLLENRQQTGWDAFLPAHGMLVWHIDYDAAAWANNQVNVLAGHQRVDLVEADGVLTKETQDGDAFPGSRQTTSLNLLPWTGIALDAPITEIRETAGVVTFKFRGGGTRIEAPTALEAEDITPTSFTAAWATLPAITDYDILVWRGDEIVPIITERCSTSGSPDAEEATHTLARLQPSTDYRYAVVAVDGDKRSPASNEMTFTTLPPTFDMLCPDGVTAELASGEAGQEGGWTLVWEEMEGAASYEIEVYQHNIVAPSVVALDFTGGIASLPAGWTTTSTQTSGVSGTFGAARPSLMLLPGEYLQSPVFAEGIVDYEYWSLGEITTTASGQVIRFSNDGQAVAYLDDIVITYGGRTEQTDVTTHSTALATLHIGAVVGTRYARVRGVTSDGVRSEWSAEVALPTLENLPQPLRWKGEGNASDGRNYVIPPFISISPNGRKSWSNERLR